MKWRTGLSVRANLPVGQTRETDNDVSRTTNQLPLLAVNTLDSAAEVR